MTDDAYVTYRELLVVLNNYIADEFCLLNRTNNNEKFDDLQQQFVYIKNKFYIVLSAFLLYILSQTPYWGDILKFVRSVL